MNKDVKRFSWEEIVGDWPMPTAERKRVCGERIMVSRIDLAPGTVVPMHSHENEQISCVISGRLKFELDQGGGHPSKFVSIGSGEVLVIPSFVSHGVLVEEQTIVLDLFSPPSPTTGIDNQVGDVPAKHQGDAG